MVYNTNIFTVAIPKAYHLVSVGEKVRPSKSLRKALNNNPKVKNRNFVARLRRKKFEPMFIITTVNQTSAHMTEFTIKPYNF